MGPKKITQVLKSLLNVSKQLAHDLAVTARDMKRELERVRKAAA